MSLTTTDNEKLNLQASNTATFLSIFALLKPCVEPFTHGHATLCMYVPTAGVNTLHDFT